MSAYAINWLIHVRQVPALRPYFLVSLDSGMQAECDRLGEPAVPAVLLHNDSRLSLDKHAGYLRNDVDGFKVLGKAKALFTEGLLTRGYSVLLSDVDSVWLADPFPFLGGQRTPGLASADVLVTNDYADVRRDDDITTVFNTGALLLRAGDRAVAFVREWAMRTEITGLIGNDQTELNRLVSSQYADGDTSCRVPDCLLPRKPTVPASESFLPGADGSQCPEPRPPPAAGGAADTAVPCVWEAVPSLADGHTNLTAVDVPAALSSLAAFRRANLALGRRPASGEAARVAHWMWAGRLRVGLLPMGQFMQGHTFFIQHLHEQTRTPPVHVHVTYTLSADYGKRFRLRSAGLWQAEQPEYYTRGHFVHVVGLREALLALLRKQAFPDGVWQCAPGEVPSVFFEGVSAAQAPFALAQPHEAMAASASAPGATDEAAGMRRRGPCYHPTHFVPRPGGGLGGPPSAVGSAAAQRGEGGGGGGAAAASATAAEIDYEHSPDPATPHVRLQHMTRLVLRNAFALASATGRRLVLPVVWCMCDRYWWHLRDCRMPGAESLTMPFACPLDMSFNIDDWQRLPASRIDFVEAAFLANPRTHAAISAPGVARTLRVARDASAGGGDDELPDPTEPLGADGSAMAEAEGGGATAGAVGGASAGATNSGGSGSDAGGGGNGHGAQAAAAAAAARLPPPLTVPSGSTIDDVAEALASRADVRGSRVLRVSAASLLRLSPCGFREEGTRAGFERDVLEPAFGGQHSYCGSERNPNLGVVLERARRTGMPDEQALILYRNCTGNPANAFNKPKVDLGPAAIRFARTGCGRRETSGAPQRSAAALAFDAILR